MTKNKTCTNCARPILYDDTLGRWYHSTGNMSVWCEIDNPHDDSKATPNLYTKEIAHEDAE